jgi:glycerol-3-phosphate dehydrogenase (NAD(P)+)
VKITVLGAGSWGTTVASLAAGRNDTILWARSADVAEEITTRHTNHGYLPAYTLPERLRSTSNLEEAVSDAEVLVIGVPTQGFRQTVEAVTSSIRPWIPVVSLTKGFEQGSLLRMTEVVKELLPGHPVAVLTGPNIAKEIMAGEAAASVIATEDLSVAAELQHVLGRGMFRIYVNHDVIGCEFGGALKNVIAIATGISQGLGIGDNTRAAVIARGLAELTRLGVAAGGEPMTFAGLTGLGDLVATCMSPHSRNRYVGEQLGLGKRVEDVVAEMKMVAEGVKTAVTAMELAERYGVEMPICSTVYRVVKGEISGVEAYRGLRIPAAHESSPG